MPTCRRRRLGDLSASASCRHCGSRVVTATAAAAGRATTPASIRDALLAGRDRLRDAGVASPYLDAVVLLAQVLQVAKERLFAALPEPLPEAAAVPYQRLVARRCAGEPVAYLRGYKEFYGRPFLVDRAVLIPRPETELLVDAALETGDAVAARRGAVTLHDVGTGSGAIAVTLSLERPGWRGERVGLVGGCGDGRGAQPPRFGGRRGAASGVRPAAGGAGGLGSDRVQSPLSEQRRGWPRCAAGAGRSRSWRWPAPPTGWVLAAASSQVRARGCAPAAHSLSSRRPNAPPHWPAICGSAASRRYGCCTTWPADRGSSRRIGWHRE